MEHPLQTRREFLRRGVLFVAAAHTAPLFLTRTGWAIDRMMEAASTRSVPGMTDGRILVVIQLAGGNDGLNTVIPYTMDEYYRARPTLGLARDRILKLNGQIGLHPGLAKVQALFDEGRAAIIQGVGYPNPNRSHFRSMDIWEAADPQGKTGSCGWLGRFLDNACPGCGPRPADINPVGGVSIGGMPLAMQSQRGLSIALDNPGSFRWVPLMGDARDVRRTEATFEKLNRVGAGDPRDVQWARLQFLSRVAMNAQASSGQIRAVLQKARTHPATYPVNGLARQLQTVAQLIAGGLDTRIFYVSIGGFDTHANQKIRHEQLLAELAETVQAFHHDLDKQGNGPRVVTMTFSEFGRRVGENASGGTDHGTAAPMFLFGAVRGGIYGTHPGLSKDQLDRGDLRFQVDFRSVYATVLENWLGVKAEPILGKPFAKLAFV